ncbi:hypothetical protein IFM89_026611 [Coptis chinensis]|uniref:Peptidase M24 domain-containing protein n=1 Tax=Coptis chinensis TaxID=261450 RepID=A0A835HHB7_9MAGN|nr:hypothetical protein IFM89_023472 [Coptis chinensis]KAF9598322.1 hypothetical protein IFM89_026611 [Coptis chinensis]
MSDDEANEEKELDLTSPEVVTKYKTAADIVNKALQLVLSECKPKAKIVYLCEKGDVYIREQTGNVYKNVKKKIERGVAFPTCISVNNTVCHFSPLASDESVLEEGNIVKIDMGCHIDGFIAVVGHTHVLQGGPVTGRAADAIAAAQTASEVALRLVKPGRKNKEVTEAIQKVAAAYDCKIVEGVLSHQLKQFVIDGNKVILSVPSPDTKVDDAEFEENEVYAIDIVTSTGDGKASDFVAHIKFTVLLMPNGSDRITSHALQDLQPTKAVDDPEIKAWLALGTKTKKKGGGKKKKGKNSDKADEGGEVGSMDTTTNDMSEL